MASSSTATPDTLITLKVNFDGTTRRFKLPLRDLVLSTLEDKLRSFLQIPVGSPIVFERYSDSAASYVLLHPSNLPAYKQLYRAAKAKQKLKLRVTTRTRPAPEPVPEPVPELAPAPKAAVHRVPKPVTVEDEPEAEAKEVAEPTTAHVLESAPAPLVPVLAGAPATVLDTFSVSDIHSNISVFVDQWRAHGCPKIHVKQDTEGKEVVDLVNSTSAASSGPLIDLESSEGSMPRCPFSKTAEKMSQVADLIQEAHKNENIPQAAEVLEISEAQLSKGEDTAPEVGPFNPHHLPITPKRPFTVCCNSCDRAVPDAHFHCSTCDDGDFDLCQDCVNQGITCYNETHWLIKRTIKDGQVNLSTTHIAPKAPRPQTNKDISIPTVPWVNLPLRPAENTNFMRSATWGSPSNDRTCNCCIQDFPGENFLHCTTCEDYDLCKTCFAKNKHGHHPGHGFTPALKGTVFETFISSRLSPGRNVRHNAICDGCDKYVWGVRHKCLDCPDWDYCSECVQNASFVHPNHRFVAIYEPLADGVSRLTSRATHYGICCDGPLCSTSRSSTKYIVGVRYKCAVCHDTDFCANCEASPANTHNKTHPLIKFKTPVRHVSVTTTGEHEDGHRLPTMGDRVNRSAENRAALKRESIAATRVQTVVDVQPTEQQSSTPEETDEVKSESEAVEPKAGEPEVVEPKAPAVAEKQTTAEDLVAVFQRDTVADGTIMPPNHTFEQVWVIRNEGTVPWPAGCSVKFVGGDFMGAVDPTHPAGIHELVSASESTVCYNALNPGQEFPFTVLMRTPDREGKVISYWRLTTPDNVKFGHKLWCDVTVQAPRPKSPAAEPAPKLAESQMIIPKLEHESPAASMHEKALSEGEAETETATLAQSVHDSQDDEFEDCGEDDEWAESDDGFMTDEEYDILDASDEEYQSEQGKPASKK